MRFQEQIAMATERAVDDIFRSARAMPEDKLHWKVMDSKRDVLDLLQECAQAANFFRTILETRSMPNVTEEDFERARAEWKQWDTLDKCEQVCRDNTEKLCAVIRAYPDEDLNITIRIPWGNGMERSMADVAMFHHWNLVYHLGQLNYIQTLYGDYEMH